MLPKIDSKYLSSSNSLDSSSFNDQSGSIYSFYSTRKTLQPYEPPLTLANERYNIQQLKNQQNEDINNLYQTNINQCIQIEQTANKKAQELYNTISYEIKWSNPPLANVHGKLILSYCKHIISQGSTQSFAKENDLLAWNTKVKGTKHEKIVSKLRSLYQQLYKIISSRDIQINDIQNNLLVTAEQKQIKHGNSLRWAIEHKTPGTKKNQFFSIWQLVKTNKLRELQIFISSKEKMNELGEKGVNTPDPDYGLTPLHYACKHNLLEIVQYLLTLGADPTIAGPDGRIPLHYAAAYGSREVILALLATGIDPDTKDNYHCTALDLARQNNNQKSITTLQNWNSLNTMSFIEEPSLGSLQFNPFENNVNDNYGSHEFNFVEDEEEKNNYNNSMNIPIEYQEVPSELFHQMSSTLQLLIRRLNGYNPYLTPNPVNVTSKTLMSSSFALNSTILQSLGSPSTSPKPMSYRLDEQGKDSFLETTGNSNKIGPSMLDQYLNEIRLCNKYYLQCLKEKYLDEGWRILKRRWIVAKSLYQEKTQRRTIHLSTLKQHQALFTQEIPSNTIDLQSNISELNDNDTLGSQISHNQPQDIDNDKQYTNVNTKLSEHSLDIRKESTGSDQIKDQNTLPSDDNNDNNDSNFDLEKLALEFFKSASNVTYLDHHESVPLIKDSISTKWVDTLHPSNEPEPPPPTPPEPGSFSEPLPIQQITKYSEKLYIETEKSDSKENHEVDVWGIPKAYANELPYSRKLQLTPDIARQHMINNQGSSIHEESDYILTLLTLYSKQEQLEYFQTYPWRFENKEIFDQYTKYSSTAFSLHDPNTRSDTTLSSTQLSSQASFFTSTSSQYPNNHGNNFLVQMGIELSDVNLLFHAYLDSLIVLEETLQIQDDIFITTRISVLFRKCQLLLTLYEEFEQFRLSWIETYYEKWLQIHETAQFHWQTLANKIHIANDQDPLPSNPDSPDSLLDLCIISAQEAVNLSHVLTSRHFVESHCLVLSLSYLSKAKEKKKCFAESWQIAEDASLIAQRINPLDLQTIQLLLESQRLFIKYQMVTEEDFIYVSKRANEINGILDEYHETYPENNIDDFWKQSAELLSLATIQSKDTHVKIHGLYQDKQRRVELTQTKQLAKELLYITLHPDSDSPFAASTKKSTKRKDKLINSSIGFSNSTSMSTSTSKKPVKYL